MEITQETIDRFDEAVSRGFSAGVGDRDDQMCVEAAICYAFDLPHGDDPGCVSNAIREFKIKLNDSNWSSPKARAEGLRNLGIAQLGSKGVVSDKAFSKRLVELTVRKLIPEMLREIFPNNKVLLALAVRCETEGTTAARTAFYASYADAAAARAAFYARADAAAARAAFYAARAAFYADAAFYAVGAGDPNKYLKMSADLALEVLRELNSPGCEWL